MEETLYLKPFRCTEIKEDLISELEDDILQLILSLLPTTKDSIRTSVLSKRWESLWVSVPTLTFCQHFYGSADDFVSSVDQTLVQSNYNGSLQTFTIEFSDNVQFAFNNQEHQPSVLDRWLRYATRSHVKSLSIILTYFDYRLPRFLCRYISLEKLSVHNCSFGPDMRFSWSMLKELLLKCTDISQDTFAAIMSGCPVLECFYLEFCVLKGVYQINSRSLRKLELDIDGSNHVKLEIWAPNLKRISTYLRQRVKLHFIDISSLFEVNMNAETINDPSLVVVKLIEDILQQLNPVEKITFHGEPLFLRLLNWEDNKRPSFILTNCKDLSFRISVFCWNIRIVLLNLLKALPNLNKLTIECEDAFFEFIDDSEDEWEPPQTTFRCLDLHLNTIDFRCTRTSKLRSKLLLNFLKFMVGKTRVLQKLYITTQRANGYNVIDDQIKDEEYDLQELSNKFMTWEKTSANAVIIFRGRLKCPCT